MSLQTRASRTRTCTAHVRVLVKDMYSPIELVNEDRAECLLTVLSAHLLDLFCMSMSAPDKEHRVRTRACAAGISSARRSLSVCCLAAEDMKRVEAGVAHGPDCSSAAKSSTYQNCVPHYPAREPRKTRPHLFESSTKSRGGGHGGRLGEGANAHSLAKLFSANPWAPDR